MSASSVIAAFRTAGTGPGTFLTRLRDRTRGVRAVLQPARSVHALGTRLPSEIVADDLLGLLGDRLRDLLDPRTGQSTLEKKQSLNGFLDERREVPAGL